MDDVDLKAMMTLMHDGRISWAALGELLGMSAPSAAERVRKLEAGGAILGYAARPDPTTLGFGLAAFIGVTLERPEHRQTFLKLVAKQGEVQECHHVAGDYDYLLKVRCRSMSDLDRFISETLKGIRGVAQTRTTIVLSTNKETLALPLGGTQP